MTTIVPAAEGQTFVIAEEITVRATPDQTFASLLVQMGRLNETPDGKPLPMMLEPHPGGRWYRDLGGDNGHLWGFVQSIRRPDLLESWGPLFMATAATSN
ncbi:MAG: SRPBCC domain-containing protein, partial [Vicinamibacterales bacterium]